jgi:hypothetical protein
LESNSREDGKVFKYRLAALIARKEAERLSNELAGLRSAFGQDTQQSVGGMQSALRQAQRDLSSWGSRNRRA